MILVILLEAFIDIPCKDNIPNLWAHQHCHLLFAQAPSDFLAARIIYSVNDDRISNHQLHRTTFNNNPILYVESRRRCVRVVLSKAGQPMTICKCQTATKPQELDGSAVLLAMSPWTFRIHACRLSIQLLWASMAKHSFVASSNFRAWFDATQYLNPFTTILQI